VPSDQLKKGGKVNRERARQIVLATVGLLYLALLYPLSTDLAHSSWLVAQNNNEIEPMFLSFFVSLGVFLLLAARSPSAYRSLILFAAWESIVHGCVMIIETFHARSHGLHRDPTDVVLTLGIGIVLLALLPAKQPTLAVHVDPL